MEDPVLNKYRLGKIFGHTAARPEAAASSNGHAVQKTSSCDVKVARSSRKLLRGQLSTIIIKWAWMHKRFFMTGKDLFNA